MNVIKRDGTNVPFDKNKIINAINAAMIEIDEQLYENDTANDIAEEIENQIKKYNNHSPTVEYIQDLVEKFLMQSERPDVARAYIRFRYKKEVAREVKATFFDAIGEKLQATNVKNQNANVDEHSFGGRIGEAASVMTKQYAFENIVSKLTRDRHFQNIIYTHDADSLAVGSHNCLTAPLDPLLANGFITRQVDIRPANSVNTALQLVAVIFQLQSLNQFGGVSASHLDWTMVPYVQKSFKKHYLDGMKYLMDYNSKALDELKERIPSDTSIESPEYKLYDKVYRYAMDMTQKEVHQGVEALYHNLNSLQSRSGNQLPFSSINYGTCTLPEGRMLIKELLEVSIDGVGAKHRTSIFPCGIFQCMKGVNRTPGDPNYDLFKLALRSTAQRLYPNYANVDWSGNAGYDRNDPRTYFSTINRPVVIKPA